MVRLSVFVVALNNFVMFSFFFAYPTFLSVYVLFQFGWTPLQLASAFGHLEIVKYLVSIQCNLRHRNSVGLRWKLYIYTLIYYVVDNKTLFI